MKNIKMKFSEMPKWFRVLIFLTPLLGILLIDTALDNDFYFLYKTGEQIVKKGFPHRDFLSMHSSMEMIVQQWMSSVIYYFSYRLLGKKGVIVMLYLCYLAIVFLSYRISKMITDNSIVSIGCVAVSDLWIAIMFIVSRPQVFTYIIVLLELYLLESYVQKKKISYLCLLPLLSLILINMHAAMWGMFFVYALPYFVNSLPINTKFWKQSSCCDCKKLFLTGIACVVPGLLNPYGTKAMGYIFSSFGVPEINDYIHEMQPTSFKEAAGKAFFFFLGLMAFITIKRKKENCYRSRFVLLFLGSMIMAFMNYKSHAYFYLIASISFSYLIKDAQPLFRVPQKQETGENKKRKVILMVLLAGMLGVCVVLSQNEGKKTTTGNQVDDGVSYQRLDEIAAIIPKDESVRLYTNFACGQYMEFLGYHPYIDGRAEVFLKANNKEYDYFIEYYKLTKGELDCKRFLEKYNFNYLIVEKKRDPYLYQYLQRDSAYQLKYKSETANLFIR